MPKIFTTKKVFLHQNSFDNKNIWQEIKKVVTIGNQIKVLFWFCCQIWAQIFNSCLAYSPPKRNFGISISIYFSGAYKSWAVQIFFSLFLPFVRKKNLRRETIQGWKLDTTQGNTVKLMQAGYSWVKLIHAWECPEILAHA